MKRNVILITLLFLGSLTLQSQPKEERKLSKKKRSEISYNNAKELIESGEFKFEARYAFPISSNVVGIAAGTLSTSSPGLFQANRINLTGNDDSIKIQGDDADIYLAYFGESRRILTINAFNNDDIPIRFLGTPEDYNVSFDDKKHKIHIKFSGSRSQEKYKFHITVNSDWSTILNVNSNGRQSIRYQGKLKPFDEDDKIGTVTYND